MMLKKGLLGLLLLLLLAACAKDNTQAELDQLGRAYVEAMYQVKAGEYPEEPAASDRVKPFLTTELYDQFWKERKGGWVLYLAEGNNSGVEVSSFRMEKEGEDKSKGERNYTYTLELVITGPKGEKTVTLEGHIGFVQQDGRWLIYRDYGDMLKEKDFAL